MTTKEFSIEIDARKENVWFALWDDYHYRLWTSVFCEGSYAVTDWNEGSKVHFLTPGGEGMYSEITLLKPNNKMYFTHKGELRNFEELPLDEKSSLWSGARENYSLTENDGVTTLKVVMDLVDEHVDYFSSTFPAGLAKVKDLAENLSIVIETKINTSLEKAWNLWTEPAHIVKWNNASDDWHTPHAENDSRTGGKFLSRMEAKDGSMGFNFEGEYSNVVKYEIIDYQMADYRKVSVRFQNIDNQVIITESFEPELTNSFELQKAGWQSILDNFKKYVESN